MRLKCIPIFHDMCIVVIIGWAYELKMGRLAILLHVLIRNSVIRLLTRRRFVIRCSNSLRTANATPAVYVSRLGYLYHIKVTTSATSAVENSILI